MSLYTQGNLQDLKGTSQTHSQDNLLNTLHFRVSASRKWKTTNGSPYWTEAPYRGNGFPSPKDKLSLNQKQVQFSHDKFCHFPNDSSTLKLLKQEKQSNAYHPVNKQLFNI